MPRRRGPMKRDRIETPLTSTLKDDFLRGLVLNTEKVTVKFDEDIVITNDAMNRKKILANMRDMEDVSKIKRMHRTS